MPVFPGAGPFPHTFFPHFSSPNFFFRVCKWGRCRVCVFFGRSKSRFIIYLFLLHPAMKKFPFYVGPPVERQQTFMCSAYGRRTKADFSKFRIRNEARDVNFGDFNFGLSCPHVSLISSPKWLTSKYEKRFFRASRHFPEISKKSFSRRVKNWTISRRSQFPENCKYVIFPKKNSGSHLPKIK